MHPFLKAQASSLAASIADFTTTVFFKEVLGIWYLSASIMGTIIGGITNFLINRNWVFDASHPTAVVIADPVTEVYEDKSRHITVQAVRYMLVWVGNLVLNAAGVYLLTHYCDVSYMVSKIFVSLVVGFCYNYLLQKRFVFSRV